MQSDVWESGGSEQRLRIVADSLSGSDLRWYPLDLSHTAEAFLPGISSAGRATCSLSEAMICREADPASVLVCLPPALSELNLINKLPGRSPVLLTVDHYVHAEQIARRLQSANAACSVVLLLKGDRPGPGIRPGNDALQLALGIRQWAPLHVAGVSVLAESAEDLQPAMNAAGGTRQLLNSAGIACERVICVTDGSLVTSVVPPVTDIVVAGWQGSDVSQQQTLSTRAEVISRPSLELAVIDLVLPDGVDPDTVVICLPGDEQGEVLRWLPHCCVVLAEGPASRLQIGDVVEVRLK